ncbi:Calcitonin gene-related peptide type 1 receptor [Amphibalanus amphitrite]|uniref:Calcitonin gene-related peptide type 1 receptor n=2 Tax=Amphibalanus amphitrite TaxID=1232801 RepID=A0A6A4WFM2_AMPAM|nr:Calcitonin gene-related peptide type 1 receptor [Amphibalanus amphitrite]
MDFRTSQWAPLAINSVKTVHNPSYKAYKSVSSMKGRAVRATLVLVPLFGLHLMVTIYRPSDGGCVWMEIYYYCDYLLDGLQGAMVALIFCYLNGEVQNLLRRTYGHHLSLHSTAFRTGHRSSSLSGRSQNTMHTMVGLDNTTSATLEHADCPGGAPLLHRPHTGSSEKEERL